MKIKFDGEEIEVKALNLNQLVDVEEKFGSVAAFKDGAPLKVVRFLAWLLIKPAKPHLTELQIGEKLDMEAIQSISKAAMPAARVGTERPFTSPSSTT